MVKCCHLNSYIGLQWEGLSHCSLSTPPCLVPYFIHNKSSNASGNANIYIQSPASDSSHHVIGSVFPAVMSLLPGIVFLGSFDYLHRCTFQGVLSYQHQYKLYVFFFSFEDHGISASTSNYYKTVIYSIHMFLAYSEYNNKIS